MPDYLTDNHNRAYESLICCIPSDDREQVIQDLIVSSDNENVFSTIGDKDIADAITSMVDSLPDGAIYPDFYKNFVETDCEGLDDYHEVYLYAYLRWYQD